MRYDTPVFFQCTIPGEYNPDTGNYDAPIVTEDMKLASVTGSGIETVHLIYGEIKQDSLTVRLQNHYDKPFDHIRIGNKVYSVDFSRRLRTKHNFVVSEVQ